MYCSKRLGVDAWGAGCDVLLTVALDFGSTTTDAWLTAVVFGDVAGHSGVFGLLRDAGASVRDPTVEMYSIAWFGILCRIWLASWLDERPVAVATSTSKEIRGYGL